MAQADMMMESFIDHSAVQPSAWDRPFQYALRRSIVRWLIVPSFAAGQQIDFPSNWTKSYS